MAALICTDLTSVAVEIAARQHRGHFDKQGEPYILHPLRVMASVTRAWRHMHPALRKKLEDAEFTVNHMRAVAVLHDTLEDTDLETVTLRAAGFDDKVIQPLLVLTREPDDLTYSDFIDRCAMNPVAIHVKLLDLTDNMNRGRGSMTVEKHESLLKRYARAKARLESRLYERIEEAA